MSKPDQERIPLIGSILLVAVSCAIAAGMGAIITKGLTEAVHHHPVVVGILGAFVLLFVVVGWIYIRMFLIMAVGGCVECLNPGCDGCTEFSKAQIGTFWDRSV